MIITLVKANFSNNNVGQLNSWFIYSPTVTGGVVTADANNPTSIDKTTLPATTLKYTFDTTKYNFISCTPSVGTATHSNGLITVTIPQGTSISANITILIALESIGGGVEDDNNSSEGYILLPTIKKALGVTSTGTGRVSKNNAKRFSTADETKANGILIPAGKTMHLKGLTSGTYPLRFDYIYCTDNVKCPVSNSTTAIEGLVGTASNYVSSNYFPMNKDGIDTADIVNNFGEDYYFWIGFAGLTLNEGILAAYDTYTLMYKID